MANNRRNEPKKVLKTDYGKIIRVVTGGLAIIVFLLTGGMYWGTSQMKQEFGERLARQETLATSLDKKTDFLIQKYILPGSKAQAENLLHGRDIQVAYLTPTSNVKLASARESKGSTSDDGIFAVYQMESFIGGKLILRVY